MYFDSDTPDEMSLFNDEREQAREENQLQRQFDRMLNQPDYLSEAAVLARQAFTPEMFQEDDADVALAIAMKQRNEYGLPMTQSEADRMLARTKAEGIAYKAWLAALAGQEKALNAKKEAA